MKKNQQEHLIEKNDKVLIAFSSGPDSVALLHCLLKIKDEYNLSISLAHINHMLRDKNSDGDELFALEIGREYGVPVFIKKANITEYAKENKIGLEEAGRNIRYEFFKEIKEKNNFNKVALAHNLDDNVETFLFRLMRGTSLAGLKGIPVQRGYFVRPLLEIKKSEIMEFLKENNYPYRVDESNNESIYTRNKIRLELIPFIEENFNGRFKEKIAALIDEIDDCVNEKKNICIDLKKINLKSILELEESEQKKVVSDFLKLHNIEVSRNKIDMVIKLFQSGGSKVLKVGNNKLIKKEYDIIKMVEINEVDSNNIDQELCIKIGVGESVKFGKYNISTHEVLDYDENMEKSKNVFYIDKNKLKEEFFVIRTRREGDNFIPTGMNNSKKIKEFFINSKIKKEVRDTIPIITNDNNIVWIGGIRGSEIYRVGKNTKHIIKLILKEE